jgi:hypothetical protein
MLAETEKVISLETWKELMSREFQFEEEKPRSVNRLYEMYGDDIDEE